MTYDKFRIIFKFFYEIRGYFTVTDDQSDPIIGCPIPHLPRNPVFPINDVQSTGYGNAVLLM